jgi:hypothetical protein
MVGVAASAGLQPSSSLQVSYRVTSQGLPTRFVSFAHCYHAKFCNRCNLTFFLGRFHNESGIHKRAKRCKRIYWTVRPKDVPGRNGLLSSGSRSMRCSNLRFCFLFLVLSPRHSAAPRTLLVVACTLRTQSHRCLGTTLEQGIPPGRRQGVPGIDTGRVGERAPRIKLRRKVSMAQA